jgi:hypothetical protein
VVRGIATSFFSGTTADKQRVETGDEVCWHHKSIVDESELQ